MKRVFQSRHQLSRRHFLRSAWLLLAVLGAALANLVPAKWLPPRLRPPGALPENQFLASCIKCGQCVQVCPVQAIRLADIIDGVGHGTPYLDARTQACDFSCDVLQCILACPTGSLSHTISRKEEVRMGRARVVRPQACLAAQGLGFKGRARGENFQGLLRYAEIDRWQPLLVTRHPYDLPLCDLCVRHCPIEHAISLAGPYHPPVIHTACVGCGTCEMMCPVEPTVIVIEEQNA